MKTLYIIRHAKSSWAFDLPDIDRPLARRGREDVMRIAKYLSDNENTPDIMISSPASRAIYTALFIADEWGYAEEDLLVTKKLYHADSETILEVLAKADDEANSVAIFGHNPGFNDLVNFFYDQYIDNLSTGGVFGFSLNIDSWSDIRRAKASKKMEIKPKKLKNAY